MGLLGAKMSKDKSGYFKINHIYSGAVYRNELRSPLTEPGMNISEGDFITAIDGQSLKDVDNIYRLLVGKADKLVELTVSKSAAEGGRKVVVKPIADEYPLEHYEWVMRNIRTVEEKSGGKVGDFLAEYQAGGRIVVLGLGYEDICPVGSFCGTGMHGGAIYIRTDVVPHVPAQVMVTDATDADKEEIRADVDKYTAAFGGNTDDILSAHFFKLIPNTQNPYKQLYVNN